MENSISVNIIKNNKKRYIVENNIKRYKKNWKIRKKIKEKIKLCLNIYVGKKI